MRTNLKVFRVKNNLTQAQIAERIGCQRATYIAVEKGRRNGSQTFWIKFQKAFSIPDAELWGYIKDDE